MPTNRREKKKAQERQPRNIRKTEKIKRSQEFPTGILPIKGFHFIVLFILFLPTEYEERREQKSKHVIRYYKR